MKDDILINKYWEKDYNHLGKIKKVTELNKKQNSWNFIVFTNKGKFVFRRVLDYSKSKKIETICNILDMCKRNDVKVMEPIKSKFGTYVHIKPLFYITKFYEGDTTFSSSIHIKESAKNIAKLHYNLSKINVKYGYRPDSSRFYNIISSEDYSEIISLIQKKSKMKLDKIIERKIPFLIKKTKNFEEIIISKKIQFSKQLIHGDLHPENFIFKTKKMITIIDFNDLQFNKLVKDVGFASFRFSINGHSDKKIIENNLKLFLNTYLKYNSIPREEMKYLKYFFEMETLRRISYILRLRYFYNSNLWIEDIQKQIKLLEISDQINFSMILEHLKIRS